MAQHEPGEPGQTGAPLSHNYEYGAILADAQKVTWKVEDIIGGDKRLDFSKPFLPDALAGVNGIRCLNAAEKLKLNQIRGNSYLYLFGFVEEFILPFVLDHARKLVHGDSVELRAFMTFAEEEAKHMHLFKRFTEEFAKGFPVACGAIGPSKDVAQAVLKHSELGVALVVLHLEWLTLRHYTESVRTDEALDPQFCSLLRHHWQEESQHAKLDTLLTHQLAQGCTPEQIDRGVEDFLAIGSLLDGGLTAQAQLDIESLQKATGRTFSEADKKEIFEAQQKSYRHVFLGMGMTHPNFVKTLGEISPKGQARVAEVARMFS
jgi:hypothetical protein